MTARETKICSFPSCGKWVLAHGLCSGHNTQREKGQELKAIRRFATIADRILARCRKTESGCWKWTGYRNRNGYGMIGLNGAVVRVHSAMYVDHKGLIPSGLEIDHLCRNKACCNPDHLEAVTHQENVRRAPNAWSARTACKYGHAFTPENVLMTPDGAARICRACKRAARERRRQRLTEKAS